MSSHKTIPGVVHPPLVFLSCFLRPLCYSEVEEKKEIR